MEDANTRMERRLVDRRVKSGRHLQVDRCLIRMRLIRKMSLNRKDTLAVLCVVEENMQNEAFNKLIR